MSGKDHRYEIPNGEDWGTFTLSFTCHSTPSTVHGKELVHVPEFRISDCNAAMLFVDSVRNGALDATMFDDAAVDGPAKDRVERLYEASEYLLENLEDLCGTLEEGQSRVFVKESECDLFDVSCFLTVFLGLLGWAGYENEYSDVVYSPNFIY